MMRLAVIRGICALACAIAFHAALVTGAVHLGWLSPDDATLPELDLTSVDLSFSDTPDDTAAPVAQPPAPAIDAPPPPPPEPQPLDGSLYWDNGRLARCNVPPVRTTVTPRPAEPRPTDLRPPLPTPPEPDPPKESPPPEPQQPSVSAPAAPAPSQARVIVDEEPRLKTKIDTSNIYPEGALKRKEEGTVVLVFDVTTSGRADNVRIVSSCGFAELEQAAVQAVKRARFVPARRGSANVLYPARLTIPFRIKNKPSR